MMDLGMKGKLLIYQLIYVYSFTCKVQMLKPIHTILFILLNLRVAVFQMFADMYIVINVKLYIVCPHGTCSTWIYNNICMMLTLPVV